jgi:hypothetical protein
MELPQGVIVNGDEVAALNLDTLNHGIQRFIGKRVARSKSPVLLIAGCARVE